MKTTLIAALVAALLSAAAGPAQAAEPPREEAARFEDGTGLALADGHASEAPQPESGQEDEPRKKKRRSTGDKILTGAAVVLGVGALAVGGLLVAIFAS